MEKFILKACVILCLIFTASCNLNDSFREDVEYSELTETLLTSHTMTGIYQIRWTEEDSAPSYCPSYYADSDKYIEFKGSDVALYYVLNYPEYKEDPEGNVMSDDNIKYMMTMQEKYYKVRTEENLFYEFDGKNFRTNFANTPFQDQLRFRVLRLTADTIELKSEDSKYAGKFELKAVKDEALIDGLKCGTVASYKEIEAFWGEDHIVK